MTAPTADVVAVRGKRVTVRCPYCSGEHTHAVEYLGHSERRAPGCGIERSGADRLTGYTFRTVAPSHRASTRPTPPLAGSEPTRTAPPEGQHP